MQKFKIVKVKNIIELTNIKEACHLPFVTCKIQKWPTGKHWYVKCSNGIVKKFNSLPDAQKFKNRIEIGEK